MNRRRFVAAAFVITGLALAGCSATAASTPDAPAATISAAPEAKVWPPAGMTDTGEIAWRWTTAADCRGQSGACFAVTVAAKHGCPGGVYIELAVKSGGAVVGKANDITGAIGTIGVAQSILNDSAAPKTATAELAKLNCLS